MRYLIYLVLVCEWCASMATASPFTSSSIMNSVSGYVNDALVRHAARRFSSSLMAKVQAEINANIPIIPGQAGGNCKSGAIGDYDWHVEFDQAHPSFTVDWNSVELSLPAAQTLHLEGMGVLQMAPILNLRISLEPFSEGCKHECNDARISISAPVQIAIDWTVQNAGGTVQLVPAITASPVVYVDVDCGSDLIADIITPYIQQEVTQKVQAGITQAASDFSTPLLLAENYPLTSTINVTYQVATASIAAHSGISFTVSTILQAWSPSFNTWLPYTFDPDSPAGHDAQVLPPADFTQLLPQDPNTDFIGLRVGSQNLAAEKWAMSTTQSLDLNSTFSFFDAFLNTTAHAGFPDFEYTDVDQISMEFNGQIAILCEGVIVNSTSILANASDPNSWVDTDVVEYWSTSRPMLLGSFEKVRVHSSVALVNDGKSICLVPTNIDTNNTRVTFTFPPILANNPLVTQPMVDYLGTEPAREHLVSFLRNMTQDLPPDVQPYFDADATVHT
jgi:hypothetical protein